MPAPQFFQPETNQYALGGYSFLRLLQLLSNSGNIYESEQGAWAFGLGPLSDFSRVNVAYLDDQAPESKQSILTLSPDRSFVSFLTAFNESKGYQPSGVPGRFLIWPAERFDDEFLPSTFNPANDRIVFENPYLDVIQYFQPPGGDVSGIRADKEFYYATLPGAADDCYVLLPYYGRRYASIVIQNKSAVTVATTIFGVDFQISETAPPELTLIPAFNTLTTAASQQILLAETHGLHDYLILQFDPAGGGGGADIALKVVLSDTPA